MLVSQILGCRPEALSRAARDLAAAASRLDTHIANERSHLATLAIGWTGASSDAAQNHAAEMIGDQRTYHSKLISLQVELSSASAELGRFRTELTNHVTSAAADYYDVSDKGRVTLGTKLNLLVALSPTLGLTFGLRRLALQTAIETALHQFAAADKASAEALRRIDEH